MTTQGQQQAGNADTQESADGPFTGWHFLYILIGVFLVVGGVNAYFVHAALTSFSGEAVQDAYARGLAYNETLERRAAMAETGWQGTVSLEPVQGMEAGATHRVSVTMADAQGVSLESVQVRADIRRPVHDGADVSLDLEARGGGLYQGLVSLPADGQWEVRVEAVRGEERVDLSRRVVVR